MDTLSLSKHANNFRITFDDFGKWDGPHAPLTARVLRITRPHLLRYKLFDVAEAAPIEIDLRDDESDIARQEVLTQIIRQIDDDARFTLVIETLDRTGTTVLERWRLLQCQIVDCRFDDLNYDEAARLQIHLLVSALRIVVSLGDSEVDLFKVGKSSSPT